MKLIIDRNALLAGLTPAEAITNRRSPSPFGSAVVLRSVDQSLVISSRDMTASVRSTVACNVAKSGVVAVTAEDLLDRVKAMPSGSLNLDVTKGKLRLSMSKRDYTMRAYESADSFPAFPVIPEDHTTLSAKSLRDALASVTYACGPEEEAMFNCVCLAANDQGMSATTGTGKRIVRASIVADGAISAAIPEKAAKVLLEALASNEGDVTIASNEGLTYVKVGNVEMTYQRPGMVAPYDQVLGWLKSEDGPSVERGAIMGLLRAVTPDGTAGSVPVTLTAKDGVLRCEHVSTDGDVSTDEIEVGGAWDWSVCAEARYMSQAIGKMSGDSVRLCVHAEQDQPLVIRGESALATIGRIVPQKAA